MSGDFECRKCGVRIYSPEWDGGEAPTCRNVVSHPNGESVVMTHVD
jgi:hypothetical protein